MIIYKAENLINGKLYIGQTTSSLNKRASEHFKKSLNKNSKSVFHTAIRKYGKENFKFSIIRFCFSKEELNEKEKYYIKKYNTISPNGYNLTPGGDGIPKGYIFSKESSIKKSLSTIGINNARWLGEDKIIICANKTCGKSFKIRPYDKKKYCNKECCYSDPERMKDSRGENNIRWAGGKKKVVCKTCGNIFEDRPNGTQQYCSYKCLHNNPEILKNRFEKIKESINSGNYIPWNRGLTWIKNSSNKRIYQF